MAACIPAATRSESPPIDGPSSAPVASAPTATATDAATDEPATPEPATPEPTATSEPTQDPSASASASASADPGAAARCAGNDSNREFFASIAEVVAWPVFCPVLPSGWFVDSGLYRLAGGGWLEIAYRGPGGARLELREGTACASTDCLPSGDELGSASFGDLPGSLVRQGDGRLAVVVGPSDGATWVAIGSGLDQAAFASITAALARVGG